MTVKYRTSNRFADYYDVDGTTVRHGTHRDRPFVCLGCNKNDCKHIDAAADYIALHPLTEVQPS